MADKYEYSEKVTTPPFRGAFVRFFEPEISTDPKTGKTKKTWGVTAIFPKGTDIGVLKAAAVEVAKKAWPSDWEAKLKHPKFKSPFKDGSTMVNKAGELYAGFEAGQFAIKLSTSQQAPGVVDEKVQPIIEPEGVYSGAWYKATVNAMSYDRSDGMGISFKLNNVQKLKDDEKLGGGGRADPTTEFAAAVGPAGAAPQNTDDLWAKPAGTDPLA